MTVSGTTLLASGAGIDLVCLAGYPAQQVITSNDTHVVVIAAANTSLTVGKVPMANDVDAEIESATNLWTYHALRYMSTVGLRSRRGRMRWGQQRLLVLLRLCYQLLRSSTR